MGHCAVYTPVHPTSKGKQERHKIVHLERCIVMGDFSAAHGLGST